jgi:hypothetical protein
MAAQAPAVRPGLGAKETIASIMTRRRCLESPAEYPAALQLS